MLTLVEVRTALGALLSLPLQDVSAGFSVDEITGLGPVKATIVSSNFANMDGSQLQSSRRESRDLTMRIGFEPDYTNTTVRQLRNILYDFFMPKTQVQLRFYMSDGLIVNIDGLVESCEPDIFSKDPALSVSVYCFDPDFYELEPVVVASTSTAGETQTPFTYDGSVESGLTFTLAVDRTIGEFTLYHTPPDGSLRSLGFVGNLVAGDVLTINTNPGAKSIIRNRSGSDLSVLYGLTAISDWLRLTSGSHQIRLYMDGAAMNYTITYTNKYGGL